MASNKRDLKAYVRYDGTGRVIPGSLILQRFKPKDGNWQETQAYECCDPSCRLPIYSQDWIIFGQEEGEAGITFDIATNPFENFTLQIHVVNCETGQGIGEIATIGPENGYEYAWFVPIDILNQGCTFRVRQVCGFNYTSTWISDFGN